MSFERGIQHADEDDAGMPRKEPIAPLEQSSESREVAESNLAKDLVDELKALYAREGRPEVVLQDDITCGIITRALKLLEQQNPGKRFHVALDKSGLAKITTCCW